VGTAIYTLANAGCALAPDLVTLSVLRFVAAVGGSASMVIPRAIVRDLSEGHAAAKLMSRLILVSGAAPILAPSLGSLMLGFWTWHSIFWFCAGYGAICFALVVARLPDTLPKEKRIRLGPGAMAARYGQIIRDRSFFTHAMMGGAGMFGMFAFIGGAPGALIDGYHFSTTQFGIVFSSCASCFIICSQINPRILPRFGADRVLTFAVRGFLTAAICLFVGSVIPPLFGLRTPWWMLMPFVGMAMGCQGFNMPNSAVGALSRQAGHAGTASALMGMMQFCLAATSGLLVGLFSDGTLRPVAVLLLIGSSSAVVADMFRRRKPPIRPGLDKIAGA
jgi:DHA1 family bicyclomycin/chloramphenicol resistance-like MFS transporter